MEIKRKIYIKIIAMAFLVILAGVLPTPYLLGSVKEAARSFNAQKDVLEFSRARDNYLDSLRRDYSLVENNIQILRDSFLASGQEINFIQEIEKISAETDNAAEIRILASQEEDRLKSFGFQIVLYGAFPNLLKFLAGLENGKYQAAVTDLGISGISASEAPKFGNKEIIIEAGGLKSILNIRAYVLDNR